MARQTVAQVKEAVLPDRVRALAAQVCAGARRVRIRTDRIADYADFLLGKYDLITDLDPRLHLVNADQEETARYVLALDSINFGSGFFETARRSGVELEYGVIAGGLRTAFLDKKMNTPEQWSAVTAAQCHEIFGIPEKAALPLDTLISLFAKNLADTGRRIQEEYDGQVLSLVNRAGSACVLAETVSSWPSFAGDPFHKRPQILASDMQMALKIPFADMDRLTIFADNMVPHVLRCDGVLEYDADLSRRIDTGEMIVSQSAEEMEIRAAAIHAVEGIKAAALEKGHRVTSVNLDHILWHRGYEPEIYRKPSHRTLTSWY